MSANPQNAFEFATRLPLREVTQDPVARAEEALRRDPLGFCHVTLGWFQDNKHVWREFYQETERLRRAGVRHYGAKAVWEHLRFETAVREKRVLFKLNNSYTSGLARLYNQVSGTEFFETRDRVPA